MMLRSISQATCRHPTINLLAPVVIPATTARRTLVTTHLLRAKQLPPRPKPPPDSEIEESYLKGSGPGGQKINKTNSAVQLKHTPTGIVVKSQATRSRDQNRKQARELLAQRIDDLRNGDRSRSAIVGELKRKKAASASKKSRRKYRKLDEGEAGGEGEGEGEKSADSPGGSRAEDKELATVNKYQSVEPRLDNDRNQERP